MYTERRAERSETILSLSSRFDIRIIKLVTVLSPTFLPLSRREKRDQKPAMTRGEGKKERKTYFRLVETCSVQASVQCLALKALMKLGSLRVYHQIISVQYDI